MNSSVTEASATSVMSSLCFEISPSRRSNGPSKTSRCTSKATPVWREVSTPPGTSTSGCVATGNELASQAAVGLRARVCRSVRRDRLGGDGGVRDRHRSGDDGVKDVVLEVLYGARHDLTVVQRAAVVHRG